MEKLCRSFYQRNALTVAKELLGKILVHNSPQGKTSGKIVETEAYLGIEDPASHAYKRERTPRTEIQYKEGGYVYIYQIYGMYFCLNVVTGKINQPHSVHIRALEPLEGIELMLKRRGINSSKTSKGFANGPAKLCQAMGIDKNLYGENLTKNNLFICSGETVKESQIQSAPRIGIDYAGEAKHYPWRFYIKGNIYISVTKISQSPKNAKNMVEY